MAGEKSPSAKIERRGGTRQGAGRKSAALEAANHDSNILYNKAKAKKAAFDAQTAELEFNIKSGKYVLRADVQQAASTAFATISQSLRSIPDNLERRLGISPELSEEVGNQIDEAMNNLADELEKMSGGAI